MTLKEAIADKGAKKYSGAHGAKHESDVMVTTRRGWYFLSLPGQEAPLPGMREQALEAVLRTLALPLYWGWEPIY